MSNLINNLTNNLTNKVSGVTSNIKSTSSNVLQNVNNVSGKVGNNLNQGFNIASTNLNSGMSNISNSIGNVSDKFMNIMPYNTSEIINSSTDFINSNNFISRIIFIVLVIILFITFFKIGINIISKIMTPNESPYLYKDMKDAKQMLRIPQDPKSKGSIQLYRSRNKYNGLEFTYSTWIYVDDPTYKSNQRYKHIFHKGNDLLDNYGTFYPNNAPGLYLYNGIKGKYVNPDIIDTRDYANPIMSLLIRQSIFPDNNTDDTYYHDVDIEGIPINKWICIIVRVNNQNIMDVFINGKLMKRAKLKGVIKQNYDDVYVNMNGGFSGYLSSLKYYNYAIGTFEINSIVTTGPSLKMDENNLNESKPNYLSSKWFFSESNPKNI